jgi:type VI secretion system secreted protein Hcp
MRPPQQGSVTKEDIVMGSWTRRFVASAILVCSLVAALPAMAAISMCLKLTGITGESQINQHVGEIDVLSWGWGVNRDASQTSAARSIGGAAKVSANALVITKYIDSASPVLFQSALQGKRIAEATFVIIKAGGKSVFDVIKIKLKDVVVTSVKTGIAAPNDRFTEEVSLTFASAEYTYVPQKADQTAGAAVTVSW